MGIQKEIQDFEEWAFQASNGWASFNKDSYGKYWPDKLNLAWEAWKAAKEQAVPEGFVLMPIRPTEQMIKATDTFNQGMGAADMGLCYQAMIEAQEQSHE